MVDADFLPLVLDNGSHMSKCGFSGDDAPRVVFPTIVGRHLHMFMGVGMDIKDCYVGDEAVAKRGILRLKSPVEFGYCTNWNDLEKLWHHTFYNELRVTPEEHPVLLTERPHHPVENREKTTEIMFETFNVVAFYLALSEVLSLHASGRQSGLVLDSGICTSVVPIHESHSHALSPPPSLCKHFKFGGDQSFEYIIKLFAERGFPMTRSAEKQICRDIVETHCYVSQDFEEELVRNEATGNGDVDYELPDGSKLVISSERFRVPECLFRPSLLSGDAEEEEEEEELPSFTGIHNAIWSTLKSCPDEIQEDLSQNIVLAGGCTMFEGFVGRLTTELSRLGSVKVSAPAERKFSQWIGGSILTSLSSFENSWITKDEYDDVGPSCCLRKKSFQ